MRAAFEAAAALLRDGEDREGSADPYITDEKGLKADGQGKWNWDEVGWGYRIRNAVVHHGVRHLDYLFALCVVASPKFHAAAAAAFAAVAGCDHRPAPMKTQARCRAKCRDPDEYGKLAKPQSQHLKDILRCTVACDGLAALGAAYDAALEAFEVVSVKDRLEEATHDVVLVARFEGVLVELQLHFKRLHAIKPLAHRVYDFSRNMGWHEDEAREQQLAENERAREEAERKARYAEERAARVSLMVGQWEWALLCCHS